MKKMTPFAFLLLLGLATAGIPAAAAKTATLEEFISTEEAIQKATRQAKLGPLYSTGEVKLAYDSQGQPWYSVDFSLTEPSYQKTVFGKRIILDPVNGNKIEDKAVLKEMNAWISREEATRAAFRLFGLEKDYEVIVPRLLETYSV